MLLESFVGYITFLIETVEYHIILFKPRLSLDAAPQKEAVVQARLNDFSATQLCSHCYEMT